MTSSPQDVPVRQKTFPPQVAPVQRPNPLKYKTLIQAHEAIDFENRVKMLRVIEQSDPDDPRGKPIYRQMYIASGNRLIGARVDLMNGANFNDPAPFQTLTYEQWKR